MIRWFKERARLRAYLVQLGNAPRWWYSNDRMWVDVRDGVYAIAAFQTSKGLRPRLDFRSKK